MVFNGLNHTVTIVNNSGKIVSTGKHIASIFREAHAAYREKKAEIKAQRDAEFSNRHATHPPRERHDRRIRDADTLSRASSTTRRSRAKTDTRNPVPHRSSSIHSSRPRKPPLETRHTEPEFGHGRPLPTRSRTHHHRSPLPQDLPVAGHDPLARRHSDGAPMALIARRPGTAHSASGSSSVDMDLAYGTFHPDSLVPLSPTAAEADAKLQLSTLTRMLDEANALQHSVSATIAALQANPDALAAVALTLAEVSKLASKMAPGALATLKSSFPAAMGLLASPQFAIAVGVGVGVTVVMLGGYKIIKRIKAKKEGEMLEEGGLVALGGRSREEQEEDELLELRSDFGRIERWRRGIPMTAGDGTDGASMAGTSVEGEFVTPGASRVLLREGMIREGDLKSMKSSKTHRSSKSRRTEGERKRDKPKDERKKEDKDRKRADKERRERRETDRRSERDRERERRRSDGESARGERSGWKRELSDLRTKLLG